MSERADADPAEAQEGVLTDYEDRRIELAVRLSQRAAWAVSGALEAREAIADRSASSVPWVVTHFVDAPWRALPDMGGAVVFLPGHETEHEARLGGHAITGRVRLGQRWSMVIGESVVTLLRTDLRIVHSASRGHSQPSDEVIEDVAARAPERDIAMLSALAMHDAYREAIEELGAVFETDCGGDGLDTSHMGCAWSAERSDRDDVAHVRVQGGPFSMGRTTHLVGRARSAGAWTLIRSGQRAYVLRNALRIGHVVPLDDDERAELLRLRVEAQGGRYGTVLAPGLSPRPLDVWVSRDRLYQARATGVPGCDVVISKAASTLMLAIENLCADLSTPTKRATFTPPSTGRTTWPNT